MFHRFTRTFRLWRARRALVEPLTNLVPGEVLAYDLVYPELWEPLENGPEVPPYRLLAGVWDEHGQYQLADYPAFLTRTKDVYGVRFESVLDLACGTGLLTRRMAAVAGQVVGVDVSPDMLAEARRRSAAVPNVSFAEGDFRRFDLAREFDLAVCSSNSLNYIEGTGDLTELFRTVARHLRTGGLFVFDAFSSTGMLNLNNVWVHAERNGRRYALHFRYDHARRRERAWTVFAEGFETHRRIPIDPAEVGDAADGTGLEVLDHFSNLAPPLGFGQEYMNFFVLRRE
jgi:SAM-dependent methyltransferase